MTRLSVSLTSHYIYFYLRSGCGRETLDREPFAVLGYKTYSEAADFAPQQGVWEVRQKTIGPSSASDKCNTQVVRHKPVQWCNTGENPVSMGGNYNWLVHITLSTAETNGMYVSCNIIVGYRIVPLGIVR